MPNSNIRAVCRSCGHKVVATPGTGTGPPPVPLEVCENCGRLDWQEYAVQTGRGGGLKLLSLAVLTAVVVLLIYLGTRGSTEPKPEPEDPPPDPPAEVITSSSLEPSLEGRRLMAENRRKEARVAFQQAVDQDPGSALAWSELAAAEAVLGHRQPAITAYEKALRLDSDLWIAHYNLGTLYARDRQTQKACRHLRQGLLALPEADLSNLNTVRHDLHSNPAFEDLRHETCFQSLPLLDL